MCDSKRCVGHFSMFWAPGIFIFEVFGLGCISIYLFLVTCCLWPQVSDAALVVVAVATGKQWRVDCKGSTGIGSGGSENALLQSGFVWSDHGGNSQDLLLITQRGAEFYKVAQGAMFARLISSCLLCLSLRPLNPPQKH